MVIPAPRTDNELAPSRPDGVHTCLQGTGARSCWVGPRIGSMPGEGEFTSAGHVRRYTRAVLQLAQSLAKGELTYASNRDRDRSSQLRQE